MSQHQRAPGFEQLGGGIVSSEEQRQRELSHKWGSSSTNIAAAAAGGGGVGTTATSSSTGRRSSLSRLSSWTRRASRAGKRSMSINSTSSTSTTTTSSISRDKSCHTGTDSSSALCSSTTSSLTSMDRNIMYYSTRSLSLSHHHEGQSSGMLGCPDLQPRRDVCLSELGTLEEVIGRGETSNIFSCTFEGKRAALKTIRVDIVNPLKISEVNEMLRKERDLLESLHGHPYIVRLLGSGTAGTLDEPRVFLVLERLVCNLSQALGTNKHKTALQRMWQKRNMPKRRAVTLMLQTAVALSFLHCGGCNTGQGLIIHRDVKPSNIGLDQSGCARLMDFGLCQFIPAGVAGSAEVYCLTGVTGSLRYMAPEVANCEEYCESADVYSWAVVFAEALNLRKPFEGIESVQFKRGLTSNEGLRPELTSKKVSKGLRSLLEECWARDPVSRPTFEQVVPRLTTLLERDFPVSPCVRECLL